MLASTGDELIFQRRGGGKLLNAYEVVNGLNKVCRLRDKRRGKMVMT